MSYPREVPLRPASAAASAERHSSQPASKSSSNREATDGTSPNPRRSGRTDRFALVRARERSRRSTALLRIRTNRKPSAASDAELGRPRRRGRRRERPPRARSGRESPQVGTGDGQKGAGARGGRSSSPQIYREGCETVGEKASWFSREWQGHGQTVVDDSAW